ncbi:MAG: type II toxin-antitoxin system Phd/YefM family antitoxin [Solirubrobacteraceae bacterium]
MTTVGVQEAKTHLSRLLERALAGEDVVITRRGRPAVRLTPVEAPRRSFASLRGTVPDLRIAEDFDDLPDDVARSLGVVD